VLWAPDQQRAQRHCVHQMPDTAAATAAKSSGGSAPPISLVHEVGHAAQSGAECARGRERRVELAMRRPPPRLALHLAVKWGDDERK
jgi:hypothetical protein